MVSMGRKFREDRSSNSIKLKLTQHKLWMMFIVDIGLRCADLWDLVLIMIRIAPHSGKDTGWTLITLKNFFS